MSCYEHFNKVLEIPQVAYDELTGADATVQYSAVWDRSKYQKMLIYLRLPDGVAAAPANFPTKLEAYGVVDDADAANTRHLVTSKDLTGLTDWEGQMVLEVDETHFGKTLGKNADDTPETLDYLQVAMAGPNTIVYDVVVAFCNPYTQKPELVEELA